MRTALFLALVTSVSAEVTVPQGYHIVQISQGETYATPAPPPAASTTGSKRIRRPAGKTKGKPPGSGSGFKAPTMATRITGIHRH